MAIDNFEDLFLSDEEKAAKRRQQAAQKKADDAAKMFKESSFDDIPSFDDTSASFEDLPPLEAQKPKSTLDDTFNKLKEQFNIDDNFMDGLKEKKNKFTKEFSEKFKDADKKAENFNKKADEAANSAMDFFFDTGKKAVDSAKDLFEKGKKAAYDLEEKMRQKDEAAEAELKNPKHKLEDNLLGGFDSFFDKAKRFADRLEKKVEDRFPLEEDIKITKSEIKRPKSNEPSKIFGFDDLDGDGDPLIDDAIIEE